MDIETNKAPKTWGIVLASSRRGAGAGSRDEHATGGLATSQRIAFARRILGTSRVMIAGARPFVPLGDAASLDPDDVLLEPADRGSGASVLLATLQVFARDPSGLAVIVHGDENGCCPVLSDQLLWALWEAKRAASSRGHRVVVLAEHRTPGTGPWVLPFGPGRGPRRVISFVAGESPSPDVPELIGEALSATGLVVAEASALIELFHLMHPTILGTFLYALSPHAPEGELARLYGALPTIDFVGDVLARSPGALSVVESSKGALRAQLRETLSAVA